MEKWTSSLFPISIGRRCMLVGTLSIHLTMKTMTARNRKRKTKSTHHRSTYLRQRGSTIQILIELFSNLRPCMLATASLSRPTTSTNFKHTIWLNVSEPQTSSGTSTILKKWKLWSLRRYLYQL